MPNADDGYFGPINFTDPFVFFNNSFTSIYISINGLISFIPDEVNFSPVPFPLNVPVIAPFWSDIDTTNYGDIFFRKETNPSILNLISSNINQAFPYLNNSYESSISIIITWYKVASYWDNNEGARDSFQCVLSTNGLMSFITFNYGRLDWPNPNINLSVQIGYDSGDFVNYINIGELYAANINDINIYSNVNTSGRYIYRVDKRVDLSLVTSTTNRISTTAENYLFDFLSVSPQIDFFVTCQSVSFLIDYQFFSKFHSSALICSNGVLLFGETLPNVPLSLPSSSSFIAPFWLDETTWYKGTIYYKEETNTSHATLASIDKDIHAAYPSLINYSSTWSFIIIWYEMAYSNSSTNQTSTFQVSLASNGSLSFIIFSYSELVLSNKSVLFGYDSGDGFNFYLNNASFTSSILNLTSNSNVNQSGKYIFQVDTGFTPSFANSSTPIILTNEINLSSTTNYIRVSNKTLYSYGLQYGDSLLPSADDFQIGPLDLEQNFAFFNKTYSVIYLSTNGKLSFDENLFDWNPERFPNRVPIIAPYWSDINTDLGGEIFFRQDTRKEILALIDNDINLAYPNLNYVSTWLFIATWFEVACVGVGPLDRVTFQVVLSSNGSYSFIIFNYDTLTWPSLILNKTVLVGYDAGDEQNYLMFNQSFRVDVTNLNSMSNVDQPGRYIYQVNSFTPIVFSLNSTNVTTIKPSQFLSSTYQNSTIFLNKTNQYNVSIQNNSTNANIRQALRIYSLRQNILVTDLLNQGYYEVYNYAYSYATTTAQLALVNVTCDRYSILCAAGGAANSNSLLLVSCGNCWSILSVTQVNRPRLVNGAYWYMTPNYSFGFAPNATINQITCDKFDTTNSFRLCWHLDQNVGGWRIGSLVWFLNQDFNYVKYLFVNSTRTTIVTPIA